MHTLYIANNSFNMCCGVLDFRMYISNFLGNHFFLFILSLYENQHAETGNLFKLDNPSTLCLYLFSKSLEHCLVMQLKVQDDLKSLCCIARQQ